MAGHSKFKNIMYRKGAQDAKRAKVFTKIGRELTVAARAGPDPEFNAALRSAIVVAKAANMPKDNIERAIKRGSGGEDGVVYDEITYEGYGPGGVALIVKTLTENRNRTAAEVRTAFSKHGGNMGETGSVAFQFSRVGAINYGADVGDVDTVFEAALEAGADDVASSEEEHAISCATDDLHSVSAALETGLGAPQSARLIWRPQNSIEVDEKAAATLLKLIEALDDSDDVQTISANYDISDDVLERLTA